MNSGEIIQEYDQHLGPVNTITFVDENRRFVTTSDDKTIRAWDYDIPVVIKYIAEPHMHSMPAVTLHPSSTRSFVLLFLFPLRTQIVDDACRRQILRRAISRQSNSYLQYGQFPAEPQEAIRRPLGGRIRLPGRLLAGRKVDK